MSQGTKSCNIAVTSTRAYSLKCQQELWQEKPLKLKHILLFIVQKYQSVYYSVG